MPLLGLGDSETAMSYLEDLSIGDKINIGAGLGLTYETLRKKSTEKFHEEMVKAWLLKKDSVATVGIPTWKSLIAVLQEKNFTHVINRIHKGQ